MLQLAREFSARRDVHRFHCSAAVACKRRNVSNSSVGTQTLGFRRRMRERRRRNAKHNVFVVHTCMPDAKLRHPYYARLSPSIMPGQTWRDNGHKALCPLSQFDSRSSLGSRARTHERDSRHNHYTTNARINRLLGVVRGLELRLGPGEGALRPIVLSDEATIEMIRNFGGVKRSQSALASPTTTPVETTLQAANYVTARTSVFLRMIASVVCRSSVNRYASTPASVLLRPA